MLNALRAVFFFAAVVLIGSGLLAGSHISDGRWLMLLGAAWLCLLASVWTRLPKTWPTFNRSLLRTAIVLTTVFAIVCAQLVRVQVTESDAIAHRIGNENGEVIGNPRLSSADLTVQRGRIFDRNGTVLADTVRDGNDWKRVYPEPAAAYLMGYYSPLIYGSAGLEQTYNGELSGEKGGNPLTRWMNDLLHRPQQGLDLQTTLDLSLQQEAEDQLDGRTGAVILIDVKTGAILAMASNPHDDPNQLFTDSAAEHDAAVAYWQQLNDDPSHPLVQRAVNGLYPPGSTFKTITAAAAIDTGIASPDKVYTDDGSLDVDGHNIPEYNRPDDSVDQWTLAQGLAWSLNVVYAQVGLALGPDKLAEYAKKFGIGQKIPFDLPVSQGQIASSSDFLNDKPALADTAFGQGELLVTPLNMALVAAAIANGGVMMQPRLVDRVTTPDGKTVETRSPEVWRTPISKKTADQVRDMMIGAVNDGWASEAAINGLVVGGKTGTAELGNNEPPHAWFIGFVGNPTPRYAVAVVLEHGGEGLAGPLAIGHNMLQAAMNSGD